MRDPRRAVTGRRYRGTGDGWRGAWGRAPLRAKRRNRVRRGCGAAKRSFCLAGARRGHRSAMTLPRGAATRGASERDGATTVPPAARRDGARSGGCGPRPVPGRSGHACPREMELAHPPPPFRLARVVDRAGAVPPGPAPSETSGDGIARGKTRLCETFVPSG